MKKLSMLLMFVIILTAKSQDRPPSPLTFTYKVNGQTKTNEPLKRDYFKQEKFMLGTQWYGHPRMLQALNMNVQQGIQDGSGIIPNDSSATYKMYHIWDGRLYENALGFEYKPTLYIPQSDRGKLITNANDPSRPIFGFSHRDGTVVSPSDSGDINFRLGLYPNDLITYSSDSVVLKKAWINNKHFYNDEDTTKIQNGQLWIFSINLRRLDLFENANPEDTILTIKLPYSNVVSSTVTAPGLIRFSEIPVNDRNNHTNLDFREDRGKALNREPALTDIREIAITYGMIPDLDFFNNFSKKDITINAYFICDGDPNNPFIQTKDGQLGLDTIDIEVKYHGKVSVGINFLRLTTPNGYDFITGSLDLAYQTMIQNTIDGAESKGYEIFGMYGSDEFAEYRFTEQHYNSHLLNFCTVSEGAGGEHFDHYRYHVEPMSVWTGAMNTKHDQAAPFYPKCYFDTDNQIQLYRLNYPRRSYLGMYSDTLNSCYETDLDTNVFVQWNFGQPIWKNVRIMDINSMTLWPNWTPPSNILTGIEAYKYGIYFPSTFQGFIEYKTYDAFYKYSNYLYSEENWWLNNFPVGNWGVENGYARIGNSRPQTGEEVRWLLWANLVMGAKGLMFDARCDFLSLSSNNDTGGFLNNIPQKAKFDSLPPDSLVFTDDPAIGGDFIPKVDSAMYIHQFINRDSTAKYLGVDKNRIYYGRKSPRIEMYYIHNWIRANDSLLMNLRLVSAFSKGYRIWRHADTARFVDTIMNNYIKLDDRTIIFDPNDANKTLVSDYGIKTRPIGRELNGNPYYEPYDSSFFDITMHRFKDDEDLSSGSFVIAALNRRTDPLIYAFDTLYYESEDQYENGYFNYKGMRFYTPSEFIEKCENGGDVIHPDPNSIYNIDLHKPNSYWQSYFWKRLGAREITIPFNYCDDTKPDEYVLLHVQELKADNTFDNSWPWWRKERFNNYIDTVIGQNSSLAVKYLPGEGKMFKVDILRPNPIQGNLAHSNQSKFIVFPDDNDSTKVRYHLTYHKPDQSRDGVMTIFYRRSYPMDRNSDNMQIVWEPEICISPNIHIVYEAGNPPKTIDTVLTAAPAQYPSIVVRKNASETNAYIVYQTIVQAIVPNFEMTACYPLRDTSKYFLNPICEKILNVGTPSVIPPIYPTILDSIVYGDPNVYGMAVINA